MSNRNGHPLPSKFIWSGLTIKLVLDDIVEDLQEVEHQVVVGWFSKEEPWC